MKNVWDQFVKVYLVPVCCKGYPLDLIKTAIWLLCHLTATSVYVKKLGRRY